MLLVSEGIRRMAQPAPVNAKRLIKAERKHKANMRRAYQLEAQYLSLKEKGRKAAARERIYNLESKQLAFS